ncbi:Cytochrome b-c1 complex subunit 2, mitochondrial [Wickerhamiella sorbophila]|uniref:Cytochrome b-c1 complex subunit 2, mitochondrial n=1 Tax=Wickerhamiella sorbophila TaxID=45607 RepID=A0A2T0FNC4_9ASCO|nr:Cytochrome b-c1 complex subunit 2, mitochondrial [Wickerhamiella sorbophila]PRT56486.1 Cytochrome b-c1 complex subunit 2, mitochondrial [Wickerhamiella sorbophila]
MLRKSVGQLSKAAGRRAFSSTEASGLKITSLDDGRAVSEVSLIVKGGSRYSQVPGTAHLLEKFAFRDTAPRSALRLTRESELLGGQFGTQLGREKLVLTTKFLREDLPYFVEALSNVAKHTQYKAYEFAEEILPLAQAEAKKAAGNSQAVAIDAVHGAAFRNGLGTPLLVTPGVNVSLAEVKAFGEQVYSEGNLEIVARGVIEGDLKSLVADNFAGLRAGSVQSAATKTYAGESRIASASPEQVVTFGFAAQPTPAFAALAHLLSSRSVKWSPGAGALDAVASKHGVSVIVANHAYSDASLLTVSISGPSAAAVKSASVEAAAVIKALGSSVEPDAAKRAVAKAKFSAAEALFAPAAAAVDESAVTAAAKKVFSSKPAVAVVGQTFALPYADELF